MTRPVRVCIFGDDPTGPTGFGRVVDHLAAAAAAAGLRPVVVGLNRGRGRAAAAAAHYNALDRADPDGWRTLETALEEQGAAAVVSVADPWSLRGLVDVRQRRPFAWVGVTPADTTPYPRYIQLVRDPPQYLDVAALLGHMDRVVAFSGFGRDAVSAMLAAAAPAGQAPPAVACIPLGVDPQRFRPGGRTAARERFRGAVAPETLLFTCVKANSQRAGFDTLLAAWARYLARAAAADPSLAARSRLYLHTHPEAGAHLLPVLLARHGVADSVLLNPGLQAGEVFPEEVMIDIHRATDVAVSAARGEGFGLPILEALSCGVPAVVPDYGAPAEYGGAGVWRVPIAAVYHLEFAATDFAVVDVDAMADALWRLARDGDLRRRMGAAGRTVARGLDWRRFESRWADLLGEVFTGAAG